MNPYIHSEISVKKRGGKIEDYYDIHQLMDSTKELCSDNRHRILHNHWGINNVIIPIVGATIINSDNKVVVIKDLCEKDHILPDFRNKFIPTLADFVECIDMSKIEDWKKSIELIHMKYKGDKEIERILLSPLTITGQLKSLIITHNSWFINFVLPQVAQTNINFEEIPIGSQVIFNNMKMSLWMDNGTSYPSSAKKLEITKVY